MNRPLKTLLTGAAAGAAAALPLGAVQVAAYHAGLMGTVPPDQVTRSLFDAVGLKPRSKPLKDALVTASHFGYGATSGAVYALLNERLPQNNIPPALKGAAYGLAVWTVSYAGWIPAAGILPPPQDARKAGLALNILGHLLYGATLATLLNRPATPEPNRN